MRDYGGTYSLAEENDPHLVRADEQQDVGGKHRNCLRHQRKLGKLKQYNTVLAIYKTSSKCESWLKT